MSRVTKNEVCHGLDVETLLFDSFLQIKGTVLNIQKHTDYYDIRSPSLSFELQASVVTIKSNDGWEITSDMRYKNKNSEVDFISDVVKTCFANLRELLLFSDKIILNNSGTGFIKHTA
jgi:hypothetical protein